MKLLNKQAITAAYWRFLGNFLGLMAGLILLIFLFLNTLTQQVEQLSAHRMHYADVMLTQRELGQQVDSIYRHLRLLNTGLVRSDRVLEQRIVRESKDLKQLLATRRATRGPHVVFYKISRLVNEILLVQDSIRAAELQGLGLRQELNDCQLRARSSPQ